MIKSLFLFLITMSSGLFLYGQSNEFLANYSLEEKPNYFEYNDDELDLIGVKEVRVVDYEMDNFGNFYMYDLTHRAFILNTDQAIEKNNKLYIPFVSTTQTLIKIEARVIKKDGEIIDLDKTKVLTAENEETGQVYKYYAYEGIEKGCVIEYLTLIKKLPAYSGNKEMIQSAYPIYDYQFHLYAPGRLDFKFKNIGDIGEIAFDTTDTAIDEVNHWEFSLDTVPILPDEDEGAYNAHRGSLIYKLDKNYTTKAYDLISYNTITQNIYESLMAPVTRSESKIIKKIINNSECLQARDEKSKIRAVEDHIKQKYQVVGSREDEFKDIATIYQKHQASEDGFVKLFYAVYQELGVDLQIVLSCSRFKDDFDKKFVSYHYLQDYLFYFPKLKEYSSPHNYLSRLGYPSSTIAGNNGLFIREVEVGGIKSAVSKIKYIKPTDKELTVSGVKVDISLDADDLSSSIVHLDRYMHGYSAMQIQPIINLIPEESREELTDELIVNFIDEDIEITDKKIYHDEAFYFGMEPFKVTANFQIDPLIQNAGENSILEIGRLIGPQQEMYQEKERVLPIASRFLRTYEHEIILHVPEKYLIKNLDDLTIHEEFTIDGEKVLYFDSSYVFENNKLVITILEYYGMIEVSPELYNDYRRIVNCAADFNKVALVIE